MLRRFSTNAVDVVAADGTYARALASDAGRYVVGVRQTAPDALRVRVDGAPEDLPRALALVRRVLGVDRRIARFDAGAARVPWLAGLARRMRGVRPPRYPTLWEACVNAIVFQQVSLHAASAILRRTIEALGAPVRAFDLSLHAFPEPIAFANASDATLRAAGLSVAKAATLKRVAETIANGDLTEAMLDACGSADASVRLCRTKGIGPWTAAVVLLRGLGRLDVFPANDSGVARGLAELAGADVDVAATLAELGDERGMLYYHLLLARLERRGEL